jgi:high-affinity nickel-transport protein
VLVALGAANIAMALRTPRGRPVALVGVRSRLLPARLAEASHPAVIAAVGAAFAVSFDTISNALVFSVASGWAFAAILGLVFTVGMVITDGMNGLWIARLVRRADARAAAASRYMSVAVGVLCFAVALYALAQYALPPLAVATEHWAPALGLATCIFLLAAYFAYGSRTEH